MDGGLENTWLMYSGCSCLMTWVAIWFSNLTHLLLFVWFLWDLTCGLSVCLTCVGGHNFSHSMNTHEPLVRFDGLLDSFLCGLVRVHEHAYKASLLVHNFVLVMLFWFFLCWSLESLSPFCSNNHTRSFLRDYISWHVSKGDSKTSFSNQILHLANPYDKLSTFILYPSLGFISIYQLTLCDPRFEHLSLVICRKEDSGWRTWALTISVFCLEWLRYGWFSICLFMAFDSTCCIVTSSLLCEISHSLSLCLLEMWNCSCVNLIS
jgi:hypothetical protein